jgi:hypothetical protein
LLIMNVQNQLYSLRNGLSVCGLSRAIISVRKLRLFVSPAHARLIWTRGPKCKGATCGDDIVGQRPFCFKKAFVYLTNSLGVNCIFRSWSRAKRVRYSRKRSSNEDP